MASEAETSSSGALRNSSTYFDFVTTTIHRVNVGYRNIPLGNWYDQQLINTMGSEALTLKLPFRTTPAWSYSHLEALMKEVTVPEKPTAGISLYCNHETNVRVVQYTDRTYIRFISAEP